MKFRFLEKKGIIDFDRMMGLLGFENYDDLKDAHYKWVDSAMQTDNRGKENKWTQSIAVGSKPFIEKMKEALGFRATGIFRYLLLIFQCVTVTPGPDICGAKAIRSAPISGAAYRVVKACF